MNCEEFQAQYLAGDDRAVRAHLGHCTDCPAELPRLDQIRSVLSEPEIWEEPNQRMETLIVDEIAGHPERSTRSRWWMWTAAAVALIAATAAVTTLALTAGRPDWEVVMAGTGGAPGAFATVSGWDTDGGSRIELEAVALPAAPDGFYYELWLSAPDRIVSAGSFRSGEDVVLWSGVPRSQVPRLWVTLEPLDGNPAPSGFTVLDSS